MTNVKIWTDGACSGNPGPGGWGAIIEIAGRRQEISGASAETTNNIMEMTACLEAVTRTPNGAAIDLWSDSQYVVKGMTEWMENWKKRAWKTSAGKPVKNVSIWQKLEIQCNKRNVTWHWVKGHAGHPENERCDAIAVEALKKEKEQ